MNEKKPVTLSDIQMPSDPEGKPDPDFKIVSGLTLANDPDRMLNVPENNLQSEEKKNIVSEGPARAKRIK